jgi:hypothetical protein
LSAAALLAYLSFFPFFPFPPFPPSTSPLSSLSLPLGFLAFAAPTSANDVAHFHALAGEHLHPLRVVRVWCISMEVEVVVVVLVLVMAVGDGGVIVRIGS